MQQRTFFSLIQISHPKDTTININTQCTSIANMSTIHEPQ